MDAWQAFFRLLRHQPPSRPITRVSLRHGMGALGLYGGGDGINHKTAVMREVLPVLASSNNLSNITELKCESLTEADLAWVFSVLSTTNNSHITSLELAEVHWATESFADSLVQFLGAPHALRKLSIGIKAWQSAQACRNILSAVGTLPPNSTLTALTLDLQPTIMTPWGQRTPFAGVSDLIVSSLVGHHATHGLQRITIMVPPSFHGDPTGADNAGTASLWRLAAHPSLRSLTLWGWCAHEFLPDRLAVLKESIRARSHSGAPPLAQLHLSVCKYPGQPVGREQFEAAVRDEIVPSCQPSPPPRQSRTSGCGRSSSGEEMSR